MKLWQHFEQELEQARRSIPGGPTGWRPERLILRDWWHWKDQEFGFAHGRLALTGQNAGGKSSILALTLPILLDGRTEPTRLDPAQSRDRFLHFYLLGADDAEAGNLEVFRYETRTGYLALEFYHVTEDRFLTIGMGVTASRSSTRRITDWWGFLLLKGQRIGRNFELRGLGETCLGRRDFTRLVADGGLVYTERGEYQRQVNHHLFGMEDDDYQALIEMLLQARRPKLGEQTGPDKVCDMLRRALPGIPTERLTRVGEVINNLEEYRRNLADVAAKAEAVGRIDRALLAVAEVRTQEAAQRYNSANGQLGSLMNKLRMQRESHDAAQQGLALLEVEAGNRAAERAARLAEQSELLQGEGADLQERLQGARDELRTAQARVTELTGRLAEARQGCEGALNQCERLSASFSSQTRQLATTLDKQAATARDLSWQEAALDLTEAARAVEVLVVSDPAAVIEGAAPGSGLSDRARQRSDAHRTAATARKALEAAEDRYEQINGQVDALRQAVSAAADRTEKAKDQATECAENVIGALRHWQEQSVTLEPGDLDITRVAALVREREAAPPNGFRELIEPLALLAERRHGELEQQLAAHDEQARRALLHKDRLSERLASIEADPGDPVRSEVRAAARAAAPSLPLFRQARFRATVPAETAALVEAAMLEAGWLDLLVAPTGAERQADAYLIAQPIAGPSLLDLLEPEPDADPETARALASIGWGEAAGECWIAADGRWRNGPAQGQVAPWAPDAAGFFGAGARQYRRERRMAEARRELAAAESALAAVQAHVAAIRAQQKRLDQEMRLLETMPWQPWFDALHDVKSLEAQREQSRARLEEMKPRLGEAERAVAAAGRTFDEAVAGLPGAGGLSYERLLGRAADYAQLARDIDYLLPLLRGLDETAALHRSQTQALQQSQAALAGLQSDERQAQMARTAAQARVELLDGHIKDPAFQARLTRLQEARNRLRELEEQERSAHGRTIELRTHLETARQQIADLEPNERELRGRLNHLLEQVKERLRLHAQLAPLLDDLERAGPVAVLPKLPRPAGDTQEVEALIHSRRDELRDIVHRETDLLRDYRPTWDTTRERLLLYEERIPLAAHQLRERLEHRYREYEGLIAEEQRKLFQDIIYEGILDELRRLIRQAREFTRRTGEKLKALRLSNGEELSLRFSPLPADQVPGARIASSLEQMEQGHHFLPEEKREVLLSTIKEEVERVRANALAAGQEISYHEAVTLALDYRNWYEYQLMSKMPGTSGAVPIRTKGFGRRSNSAKAWALAVPVLAAVAARYDASTRPDLPRLIGLDEAFAGLDTNNQENYLSFLNQLGFHWIITIPDEVPYSRHLSAAMTYRMALEGNFHSAFPILWNGEVAWEPLTAWMGETAVGRES